MITLMITLDPAALRRDAQAVVDDPASPSDPVALGSARLVLALLDKMEAYRDALRGIAAMRGGVAENCAPGDALAALLEHGDAP